MACEICSRLTHEWYDCPKKPDGYIPIAKREPVDRGPGSENGAKNNGRKPKKSEVAQKIEAALGSEPAGARVGKPSGRRPSDTESMVKISPASITKSGKPRKNARYLVACVCEVCGKSFDALPNEVKRGGGRACSMHCAGKLAGPQDVSGASNPNWKGGISAGGKSERYANKHPEKHQAHRLMTSAIRRGELIRGPCEVCGEAKTDGHHDDYSKPLSVRWLCRTHHIEAHYGRFCTQALPVDTIPKPKMGRPRLLNPTSKRADYQRDLMVRMRRDYPEKYGPKRKGTT